MKFKNKNKFKKWLKDVSKYKVDEKYLYYTLEEVENQYYKTGCNEYELTKFETKSGNPERYNYDIILKQDEKRRI